MSNRSNYEDHIYLRNSSTKQVTVHDANWNLWVVVFNKKNFWVKTLKTSKVTFLQLEKIWVF